MNKLLQKSSMLVGVCLWALSGCVKDQKDTFSQDPLTEARVDRVAAAEYNVQLGIGYLQSGDISRAKSKLNHALTLHPKLPAAHYAMGYFLEKMGEPEKAQVSYLTAIQLNPKGGREHNNYGAYLCRQHRFDLAEKEFLLAVADDQFSETAEVYENAGLCAEEGRSPKKAIQYFQKAVMMDPKRPQALLGLAKAAYHENDLRKAKQLFSQYQMVGIMDAEASLFAWQLAKSTHNAQEMVYYAKQLKERFSDTKAFHTYSAMAQGV